MFFVRVGAAYNVRKDEAFILGPYKIDDVITTE